MAISPKQKILDKFVQKHKVCDIQITLIYSTTPQTQKMTALPESPTSSLDLNNV